MQGSVRQPVAMVLSALFIASGAVLAAQPLPPGKDVIDVPAMREGLCVHNLFQSNMVLQRDKPIRIWGWAEPGEKVTVTFGGQTQSATAAADRAWEVELPAMAAKALQAEDVKRRLKEAEAFIQEHQQEKP
jgi:sialate O-acetylesterase